MYMLSEAKLNFAFNLLSFGLPFSECFPLPTAANISYRSVLLNSSGMLVTLCIHFN